MTNPKRPSYKPTAGRLVLTEEIKRVQYSLFKGIKPKIVRISGDVMDAMENFFNSQTVEGEDTSLSTAAERLMRAFYIANDAGIDSRKKRILQTGVNHKGNQLLITQFAYPVPHVKGLTIVVVALDFSNVKIHETRLRSSFWCLDFDEGYEHLEDHYTKSVQLSNIDEYTALDEVFVEMIFAVVPPPKAA